MEVTHSSAGTMNVSHSAVELRNRCRMCARVCAENSELAAVQFTSDATLTDKLKQHLNVMIEDDVDLMPKQLCQECYFALERWNEILETVKKSADFFQRQLSLFGVPPKFFIPSETVLPAESKQSNFNCAMCNIKYPDFDSLVDHELTHLPDHLPVSNKAGVTSKRKLVVRKRTRRKAKNSSESSSEEDDKEDKDFEASVPAVSLSKRTSTRKCYVEGHPIECSFCNSAFQEPLEFLSHLESHPDDSGANCSICSCKFSSITYLAHHIQEHIKNEFKPLHTYPCRKCKSGPFSTIEALEAHVNLAHPAPPPKPVAAFPCGLCSLGFDEFVDYSKHVQTHVNFRHFPCALCGCKFTKVPYLLEHVKQHANGNSRQITFMCEICPDQVFSSKHNLASHMTKKHRINANKARSSKSTVAFDPGFFSFPSGSEVTGVSLQCGLCDEVFTSCQVLASHIEEVHSKFKHLLCKKCHCKFTKLPYYLEHMSEHFANPDKNLAIPCEACDEIFSSKHNLSKHIYKKHRNNYAKLCAQKQNPQPEEPVPDPEEEPKFEIEKDPKTKQFHCKNCPLTFKNAAMLNNHLLVHVPNKCSTCHGLFETREQLKEHLTQKCRPEEKFPCPICGKQLASKQSMRIHMSLHSSERKYVCEVCAKSYRTQSALVSHRNVVHLQKSQFMCHICARTFSFKLAMKRHVMLHMGDLPHKCHICPKAFVTSNLLKIHNSKEHERRILHYCSSCKKGFVDIIGLRRHMRMVCKVPEYAIPYIRDRQFVKHSL